MDKINYNKPGMWWLKASPLGLTSFITLSHIAAVLDTVSMQGFRIDEHYKYQPNNSNYIS